MIVPEYVPGDWYAVVTDGSVALLPAATDPTLVQEIWASLREGGALTDQVHLLLRHGIAHLPPFALVSVQGGTVRAIVRGEVEVDVSTAGGMQVLTATRVSTWTEDMVAEALAVAVRAPGQGSDWPGELPVLSGVVRAAGVRVELRGADAAPAPRSVPAAEPVPVRLGKEPRVADVPAVASRPWSSEQAVGLAAAPDDAPAPERTPPPPPERTPPPAPEPAPLVPPEPVVGEEDHDGTTVLSSDVVALRRQLPDWAEDAVPGPFAVPARQTPPPAKLQLSSGLVISLNRPVLIGRAPQVSRVSNREIPRLVTVASPNQDISRTHAEVRMEGEEVVVTDLRSTNGVLLLRQGAGPQRLHPGEATVIDPGVVVDLGEGVTFVVERGA